MKNLMRSLDILSINPKLFISGKSKVYSIFGFFTSILVILLSTSLIAYYIYYTLKRNDFNVSYNKIFSRSNDLTINTSNLLFTIKIKDYNTSEYEDGETLFNIRAMHFRYAMEYNNMTGENKLIEYATPIKTSKCSESYISSLLTKINLKNYFANSYCLEPNQIINISNPFANSYEFQYMNIYVTKCTNNSICKNETFINEKLSLATISTNLMNYYVDNSNYTNPIQSSFYSFHDFVSSNYYKRQFIYFKNILYKSDNGILLPDIDEKIITTIDDKKEYFIFKDLHLRGEKILYQQTYAFNSQGLHDLYIRQYVKFHNAIAEVSAYINVFIIFCSLITSNYGENLMLYQISKEYFCIEKSDNDELVLSSQEKISIIKSEQTVITKIPFDMKRSIEKKNIKQEKRDWKFISSNSPFIVFYNFIKCNKHYKNNSNRIKKSFINFLNIGNLISIQLRLDYIKNILLKNQIDKKKFNILSKMILFEKNSENKSNVDYNIKCKSELEIMSYDFIRNHLA